MPPNRDPRQGVRVFDTPRGSLGCVPVHPRRPKALSRTGVVGTHESTLAPNVVECLRERDRATEVAQSGVRRTIAAEEDGARLFGFTHGREDVRGIGTRIGGSVAGGRTLLWRRWIVT